MFLNYSSGVLLSLFICLHRIRLCVFFCTGICRLIRRRIRRFLSLRFVNVTACHQQFELFAGQLFAFQQFTGHKCTAALDGVFIEAPRDGDAAVSVIGNDNLMGELRRRAGLGEQP